MPCWFSVAPKNESVLLADNRSRADNDFGASKQYSLPSTGAVAALSARLSLANAHK